MYSKEAQYYDKLYAFKDYTAEVQRLLPVIHANLRADGKRLLDVACGTGRHLEYLRQAFEVEGLDISEELLKVAQQRNPGVRFHCADMTDFDLGQTYAVITCLFSAIGYVKTLDNARRAIGCMVRHLAAGGVLLLEPWLTPGAWKPGVVHASLVDEPQLKIARMNTSGVEGRLSYFEFHYLIGTPEGADHFTERHELGLFATDELRQLLEEVGLATSYDPDGITGRGLFIGQKPR